MLDTRDDVRLVGMGAVDRTGRGAELRVYPLFGSSAQFGTVQLSQHHGRLVEDLHLGQPRSLPQHLGADHLTGDVGATRALVFGVGLGPREQVIPRAQRRSPGRQQSVLDDTEPSIVSRGPGLHLASQMIEGSQGEYLFDRWWQPPTLVPLHDAYCPGRGLAGLGMRRENGRTIRVEVLQGVEGRVAATHRDLVKHDQGRGTFHRQEPLDSCQSEPHPVPAVGPPAPRIEVVGEDESWACHDHNSSMTTARRSKVCSASVRAFAARRMAIMRVRSERTCRASSIVSSALCWTSTSLPGS